MISDVRFHICEMAALFLFFLFCLFPFSLALFFAFSFYAGKGVSGASVCAGVLIFGSPPQNALNRTIWKYETNPPYLKSIDHVARLEGVNVEELQSVPD